MKLFNVRGYANRETLFMETPTHLRRKEKHEQAPEYQGRRQNDNSGAASLALRIRRGMLLVRHSDILAYSSART